MKKIGVLGGAFNPVHNAHIELAKAALDSGLVEEVWLMPTGKSKYKKNELIADFHRVKMLELATENMENIRISDIELRRDDYCYTYDTAMILNKMEDKYYFIIGFDSFLDLKRWYRADELVDIANFIVAFREGYFSENAEQKVTNFGRACKGDFEYLDVKLPDISSTQIRESISEKRIIKKMLPESVADYIMTYNLYV